MPTVKEPKQTGTDQYVKDSEKARTLKTCLDGLAITDVQIARHYGDQPPTEEQAQSSGRIREAARAFSQIVKDNTRGSADQSAALRLIRQANNTAHDCVMFHGK